MDPTKLQNYQIASSGLELSSNDLTEIKEEKINLPLRQSDLLLEEILRLIPKINDSKKVDSQIIQVAGGDMSGGGSTLTHNNQRFFLDLYRENVSVGFSSCNLNSSIKRTQFLSKFNFEASCLGQIIAQILDRTQKIAPRLHQSFMAIYRNLPFYFSSGKFRILDENFFLDPLKEFDPQMTISTTALYIKNLGIVISLPQFLELSESHQVGLVIHEILRSLQIQFSLKMTNSEIQQIVAALFSGDEDRLLTTLKKSRLSDFLELQKEQDPLLKEIFSYYSVLINLNQELGATELKRLERLIHSETTNWSFELSDILAQTSREILTYRIKSKQKVSQNQLVPLENLEEKIDRMVVQTRGQGIRGIYTKTLDRVAELTGFLLNYNGHPFSYCAELRVLDQHCSNLSQKLKALID